MKIYFATGVKPIVCQEKGLFHGPRLWIVEREFGCG